MLPDIQSGADIRTLVDHFYAQVQQDEVLGPVFNQLIGDRWDVHLPVIYAFWKSVLLNTAGYRGHVVQKHLAVNSTIPLTEAHRERWLALWNSTLAQHFEGPVADDARSKARNMMDLIFLKIAMARVGRSLL